MKATGLSRQGVRNGLRDALARGTVRVVGIGKQGIKRYTLNFVGDEKQLVNEIDQSTTLTKTSLPSRHTKEKKERTDPSGSDASQKSTPKKKRQRSEAQLRLDAMKNALADAFGLAHDKVTHTKWNEFGRAGKELLEVRATPEDIKPLHAHCVKLGWEGFSSMALAKEYANYVKTRQRTAQTPPTDEAVDENLRKMGIL
jgi:hypothetical protein